MIKRNRIFVVCLFLFLFFHNLRASNINYSFKHITVEDGLSVSWVKDIAQDTLGFMWFATNDGLNKLATAGRSSHCF